MGNFYISEIFPKRATQKFLCSKNGILKRTGFLISYQNIYWASKGGFTGSLCLYLFSHLIGPMKHCVCYVQASFNSAMYVLLYVWVRLGVCFEFGTCMQSFDARSRACSCKGFVCECAQSSMCAYNL